MGYRREMMLGEPHPIKPKLIPEHHLFKMFFVHLSFGLSERTFQKMVCPELHAGRSSKTTPNSRATPARRICLSYEIADLRILDNQVLGLHSMSGSSG